MAGDATLFMRRDAVEAAWEWITGILDGWKEQSVKRLPEYAAGTWGPVAAERLVERLGQHWRAL